jgi:hypothetical protein
MLNWFATLKGRLPFLLGAVITRECDGFGARGGGASGERLM